MRRKLILFCIAAQVLVLGVMAGEREYILNNGQRIYLRTAPIDPRDPFRGDFVRLRYEFAQVSDEQVRGALADSAGQKGDRVYAVLAKSAGDLYRLDYISDEKPEAGLFLRGRLRHDRRATRGLAVNYGIEQLFVEQGTGKAIERRRGTREGLQVPMEVEIAVGASGTAVIRGFRWSELGSSLKMLRIPRRNRNTNLEEITGPLSPKLLIGLQNVSDKVLMLADPGDHCGFQMRKTARVSRQYRPAYDGCRGLPVSAGDLIALAPGEAYTVELDLSEPRWHVEVDGNTGEIGRYAGDDSFRMVYEAPEAALVAGGDEIWKGELPTRAFTAFQLLD